MILIKLVLLQNAYDQLFRVLSFIGLFRLQVQLVNLFVELVHNVGTHIFGSKRAKWTILITLSYGKFRSHMKYIQTKL